MDVWISGMLKWDQTQTCATVISKHSLPFMSSGFVLRIEAMKTKSLRIWSLPLSSTRWQPCSFSVASAHHQEAEILCGGDCVYVELQTPAELSPEAHLQSKSYSLSRHCYFRVRGRGASVSPAEPALSMGPKFPVSCGWPNAAQRLF